MEVLSAPLLLAGCALLLTFLWWRRNSKLPPGPWGLPLVGYYPFLTATHLDFTRLSEKHGNIFSFRTVGGRLIVVLNGLKVIKEVLVNRAEEFIGRPHGTNIVSWLSGGIV